MSLITARIAADEYFMTTTSSGAVAVGQWIESWLQGSAENWRVHVVPATDAFASMNVAGPKSAELLRRLTQEVDFEKTAFPYMGARKGRVAGVDGCYLLRLGFTGEMSYELHVPASNGLYIWEALVSAGVISGSKLSASKHSASCGWKKGMSSLDRIPMD